MDEFTHFILGAERGEYIRVEVLGRSHTDVTDYWDGNWVNARVSARAGGFRAAVSASLRTTDFTDFREQLQTLYKELIGEATFETMEGWLSIRMTGDGRGHVDTRAEIRDEPGIGNRLLFAIPGIDQTDLFGLIAHLCEIEKAFPTIGSPAA